MTLIIISIFVISGIIAFISLKIIPFYPDKKNRDSNKEVHPNRKKLLSESKNKLQP